MPCPRRFAAAAGQRALEARRPPRAPRTVCRRASRRRDSVPLRRVSPAIAAPGARSRARAVGLHPHHDRQQHLEHQREVGVGAAQLARRSARRRGHAAAAALHALHRPWRGRGIAGSPAPSSGPTPRAVLSPAQRPHHSACQARAAHASSAERSLERAARSPPPLARPAPPPATRAASTAHRRRGGATGAPHRVVASPLRRAVPRRRGAARSTAHVLATAPAPPWRSAAQPVANVAARGAAPALLCPGPSAAPRRAQPRPAPLLPRERARQQQAADAAAHGVREALGAEALHPGGRGGVGATLRSRRSARTSRTSRALPPVARWQARDRRGEPRRRRAGLRAPPRPPR